MATNCSQLKIMAADGKRYLTDCLPQSDMLQLIEATPSRHAMTFAKWLITGENQLDSKSRDKAYQLWDSSLLQTIKVGTAQGLQQTHAYLFDGLYDFEIYMFARKSMKNYERLRAQLRAKGNKVLTERIFSL